MLESIDHINLVVADLERMAAFYGKVLGLVETKRATISGEWIGRVVGLEAVTAEVIYLDPPSGPRVELIRYVEPDGARPQGLGLSNTHGLRHLAFRVADIDAAVRSLRDAGIEILSDVQTVPEAQVTYEGGVRKQLVYFRDPEGNLLELCEYKR